MRMRRRPCCASVAVDWGMAEPRFAALLRTLRLWPSYDFSPSHWRRYCYHCSARDEHGGACVAAAFAGCVTEVLLWTCSVPFQQ